jgi:hypothetical protein
MQDSSAIAYESNTIRSGAIDAPGYYLDEQQLYESPHAARR